jgi:hypothetical protein
LELNNVMLKRFAVVYALLMAALCAAWLCFAQVDFARATMPLTGAGSTDAAAATTSLAVSGPGSGTVSVASTNFTVTLTGTTFSGTQTVTISDGGAGGTITPSVGSSGTSSVTVTPLSGTSFTFTYNAASTGNKTLTITNAQGWTNPSAKTYYSASCSQYAALHSHLDGSQNVSAVQTLICGLVTNGTYSGLDLLYVGATSSLANSQLNWAQATSNVYPLVSHGTISFALNAGWTGDGSTGYFDTGWKASTNAVSMTLNSASIGICILNNRTVFNSNYAHGTADGTHYLNMAVLFNSSNWTIYNINDNATGGLYYVASTAQGSWIATRTLSTLMTLYLNGTSVNTIGSGANNSTAMPSSNMMFLASNANGTVNAFSPDQVGYFLIGTGFTGTQVTNIYNLLHTYLTTVGAGAC